MRPSAETRAIAHLKTARGNRLEILRSKRAHDLSRERRRHLIVSAIAALDAASLHIAALRQELSNELLQVEFGGGT